MSMTVGKLHKLLGEAIAKGHARKPVCVDKETFWSPLEDDGCVILDADSAAMQWVQQIDGDGATEVNKDGTEHGKRCFVIRGDDPLGKRTEYQGGNV